MGERQPNHIGELEKISQQVKLKDELNEKGKVLKKN